MAQQTRNWGGLDGNTERPVTVTLVTRKTYILTENAVPGKIFNGKSGKHPDMLQTMDHDDAEPLVEKFWSSKRSMYALEVYGLVPPGEKTEIRDAGELINGFPSLPAKVRYVPLPRPGKKKRPRIGQIDIGAYEFY